MLNWKFILNPDTDNLEIEEPIGWDDVSIAIQRDKKYHGVSVAYGETDLTLIGEAATFIKEKYLADGIDASVQILIQLECDEVVQYEELFQIDFNQYKEECGNECSVKIGIEEVSCFQQFRNNFEKKADVDSELCFDKTTTSTKPATMIEEITLTPVEVFAVDEARASQQYSEDLALQPDWIVTTAPTTLHGYVMPALDNVVSSFLGDFNTSSYPQLISGGAPTVPPYETMPVTVNTTELIGDITCGMTSAVAKFRLYGRVIQQREDAVSTTTFMTLKLLRLPAGGDPTDAGDWIVDYSASLPTLNDTESEDFDTGDVVVPISNIQQGDKFYFGVFLQSTPATNVQNFVWEQESKNENFSYFRLEALVSCEATTAQAYMLYEIISHVMKLITDTCLKLQSKYYGRVDSLPESYPSTGCGGMRTLTSGLYIRNAEKPTLFLSMKDIIDNLQTIDNIGFAIEKDGSGDNVLKIEPVQEFYQDVEILKLDFVAGALKAIISQEAIGIVKVGYEKWQAERILGLDEFLSTREYRSSLTNAVTTLDAICKWIASSYVIEWTRQQSFALTGAADTKFDNDIFIICMMRDAYDDLVVEKQIAINTANLASPDTMYNWRLSPIRNLIRWWKWISGAFPNSSTAKFYFSSGTGNLTAEGFINDDCSPELTTIAENDDVQQSVIKSSSQYNPIIKPESFTFEYPLSVEQFKKLRANPYGYISVQCGNGDYLKYHIMKISYKPTKGVASLELRTRYLS